MSASGALAGRVAIVTGASAGIGRACAIDLARHGARVVLNARREAVLREVAREVDAAAGRDGAALVVAGDCADDAVISRLLEGAKSLTGIAARGACLVLVNAGRGLNGSVVTSDPTQWEEMVRTNVLGAARLIRACATSMLGEIERETGLSAKDVGLASGAGALNRPRDIVVLGSTVGRHISPFSSMYGSTKFAANSMAEAARRELGPRGIRVTLIEPGFVVSEFQGVAGYATEWFEGVKARIGPVLTPEDVAQAISWTCAMPARVHVNDIVIRPTRQDYP
jgi:NADP-dependent 3-hydroxy acid dehydrogenase YdfG